MKKILSSIFFIFVLFLSGCLWTPVIYEGDYPELFTEAINSIVGANGIKYDGGEYQESADLEIVQEDEYGRILFSYYEASEISTYNLVVSQASDDEYVYFYSDINFISAAENEFSEYDVWQLLEANDWGKELSLDNTVRIKITNEKEDSQIKINDESFEPLLRQLADSTGYLGDDLYCRFSLYMTRDTYGRVMFYVYGIGRDLYGEGVSPDSTTRYFDTVVIVNPDGTYNQNTAIMELTDFFNYQQDLKSFKELNHWNEELDYSDS